MVGKIPSMNLEPKALNEFLKLAVDELNAWLSRIYLNSSLSSVQLKFRAEVLCTSSDIPAARELCGLKGHSAKLGCSRCLKKCSQVVLGKRGTMLDLTDAVGKTEQMKITENMQKQ